MSERRERHGLRVDSNLAEFIERLASAAASTAGPSPAPWWRRCTARSAEEVLRSRGERSVQRAPQPLRPRGPPLSAQVL